jgi:uncharacterized protein YjbI with pentapeptide repeats
VPGKLAIQHDCATESEFEDLNLSGSRFVNINLSGSRFHDINFSDVEFTAAQIGGTVFRHIGPPPCREGKPERQQPVVFEEGTLCDSVFRRMDLTNVTIAECDITGMTVDGIPVADALKDWKKRKG